MLQNLALLFHMVKHVLDFFSNVKSSTTRSSALQLSKRCHCVSFVLPLLTGILCPCRFSGYFVISWLSCWWHFRAEWKSCCIFSMCSAWQAGSVFLISFWLFWVGAHTFPRAPTTPVMMGTPPSSPPALGHSELRICYVGFLRYGYFKCILTKKEHIILLPTPKD